MSNDTLNHPRGLRVLILFGILALATASIDACASTFSNNNYSGARAEDVADLMGRKFGRGIANVCTGWGEIPRQISITAREDGAISGATLGFFKGIFMTIARTVTGVVETATFFIPAPGNYDPILDPPVVWE
jgi:putative exosortase-associated protein (TIGR04073 family)